MANQYPSIAAIALTETARVTCSAIIISSRYVMTAAHCAQNLNVTSAAVLVGTNNYNGN